MKRTKAIFLQVVINMENVLDNFLISVEYLSTNYSSLSVAITLDNNRNQKYLIFVCKEMFIFNFTVNIKCIYCNSCKKNV